MSDTLSLTLPKARARKRRLPRPPKFTRRQKLIIAWDLCVLLLNVLTYVSAHKVWHLAAAAAFVSDIQIVLAQARGHHALPEIRRTCALLLLALLLLAFGL